MSKRSKDNSIDESDFSIEEMLTSEAREQTGTISADGAIDHIGLYPNIPQTTRDDVASPEAAQDWAQRELVRATPRAVQEVIHQLRYGSKKERAEAAKQILDRGGFKGDNNKVTNIAPVIVLTSDALSNIPWAKKAVVDGTVVVPQVASGTVVSDKKND